MANLLTAAEVASRLQVTARRVHALINAGRLPARRATPAEVAELLEAGRVRAVPFGGLQVIQEADLDLVRDRRTGYPAGRPRKPRVDSDPDSPPPAARTLRAAD